VTGARYVVVGTSGSGKSTFARKLASIIGGDYLELDALHWDADWTPRARTEFEARVVAATAGERWVADGNYSVVRHVVWGRATDIVWLDFSRPVVFSRVIRRTIVRAARREELWAGNRETFAKAFLSKDSILLWSFTTFGKNRRRYRDARVSGEHAHLRWHELRSPRAARRFLREAGMTHNSG
jgi:adenylate kinase family enzyme